MNKKSEFALHDAIVELMDRNLKIQYQIIEKYEFILSLGSQRIDSFLSYYSNKCKWLLTDIVEKNSIKLFYVPIYLRNVPFDISQAHKYGRLYHFFTHNGKIKYQMHNPSTISDMDIQSPFEEGELIFDVSTSDNHEQAEILKVFMIRMNDWEANGIDGRELFIDLPLIKV
ncbi:MAG: hypothetical protein IPO78_10240 [Saprospiraceae bacterium]|nr:hypothetical protein [Saprospiraceae bacterium]